MQWQNMAKFDGIRQVKIKIFWSQLTTLIKKVLLLANYIITTRIIKHAPIFWSTFHKIQTIFGYKEKDIPYLCCIFPDHNTCDKVGMECIEHLGIRSLSIAGIQTHWEING